MRGRAADGLWMCHRFCDCGLIDPRARRFRLQEPSLDIRPGIQSPAMLAQLTGHTRGLVGLAEIVEAVRGM